MATDHYTYSTNTSQRGLAMVLALASAVVLSPLYVSPRHERRAMEAKWSGSGLVLPMVLAGLIIAIKTTSSNSSSVRREGRDGGGGGGGGGDGLVVLSSDPSWVLRIGSSSWGLAGVLVMLILVLSWQHSVQHFLWR